MAKAKQIKPKMKGVLSLFIPCEILSHSEIFFTFCVVEGFDVFFIVSFLAIGSLFAFIAANVRNSRQINVFFTHFFVTLHQILVMDENKELIFQRNSIEFVTVAAEYCAFLERSEGQTRFQIVDTSLKILPLLYLKALLLPPCEAIGFEEPEIYVSEEIYEQMRAHLARILADKDDYLEVFTPDIAYSEGPLTASVAEGLCDIYQVLKDFIFVFQQGVHETMHDSLALCREPFVEYWGQTLVNILRPLHEIAMSTNDTEETDMAESDLDSSDLAIEEEGDKQW